MLVPIPTLRAQVADDGRTIHLYGYSPDLLDFFRRLPRSRFDAQRNRWTCAAYDSVAWRIAKQDGLIARVSLDLPLAEMADRFAHSQDAADSYRRGVTTAAQPECRATDGWRHQVIAYNVAQWFDACLLAMGMGTGKSWVAVNCVVNWNCRRTLILCPTSVRGVWQREFTKHAGTKVEVLVLDKGTVAEKTARADAFLARCDVQQRIGVVVLNYESAWRGPFVTWSLKQRWDCAVLDESHRIAGHASKISKYCAKLGERAARRLCLTGTPMRTGPLDLFGQLRFLDPGLVGDSWWQFSNRYALRGNPSIPQQITGYRNQAELQRVLHLVSYRVGSEVLDLPPIQHIDLTAELCPKARKAYDALERDLIAEIDSGVVTVDNALVKLLRLQQITSGFVPEDVTDALIPLGDEKRQLLSDLLEDAGEPVVVFCRFVHDLEVVREVAQAMGRSYGEISGRQRDLTRTAEMPTGIDVMGVQIQSGGVGIDLTRAPIAVYYSVGFSLIDYEQSVARVHRPGQRQHVTCYHLICDRTVDQRVYRALEQRRNVINAVLNGLRTEGVVA